MNKENESLCKLHNELVKKKKELFEIEKNTKEMIGEMTYLLYQEKEESALIDLQSKSEACKKINNLKQYTLSKLQREACETSRTENVLELSQKYQTSLKNIIAKKDKMDDLLKNSSNRCQYQNIELLLRNAIDNCINANQQYLQRLDSYNFSVEFYRNVMQISELNLGDGTLKNEASEGIFEGDSSDLGCCPLSPREDDIEFQPLLNSTKQKES